MATEKHHIALFQTPLWQDAASGKQANAALPPMSRLEPHAFRAHASQAEGAGSEAGTPVAQLSVEPELRVPDIMAQAPGIRIQGHVVRSFVFSTDLAVICYCDADAVLAVYPFACHPTITSSLVTAAQRPVFNGVGGSVTKGSRCADLAFHSEMNGSAGVILNATVAPETVGLVAERVDIPVMVTVCAVGDRARSQIAAGASIANVAAGPQTPQVVAQLRAEYPALPILATGGPTQESMRAALNAGADALSWTPPSLRDLERRVMDAARHLEA